MVYDKEPLLLCTVYSIVGTGCTFLLQFKLRRLMVGRYLKNNWTYLMGYVLAFVSQSQNYCIVKNRRMKSPA